MQCTKGCNHITNEQTGEKIPHTIFIERCLGKLHICDWASDLPVAKENELVEIRFKNTRKGFYRNVNNLPLKIGDVVAVEASPGHDLGVVSLTGILVEFQMKKYGVSVNQEFKKVYRAAKPADVEKWQKAIEREHIVMLETRKIAEDLKLDMKIGDVEFQGDGTKAIFYYIADDRVDFRELIKVLADRFRIRVEMKQIGARQEAGRIGGIGSCGRELCCASWVTNFVTVSTSSARHQELSLNPQKLAGQCSKLKCCLNYELDSYMDALKDFPDTSIHLQTSKGTAYHQKTDVYKGQLWYSFAHDNALNLFPLPVDKVKEIQAMNKAGKIPDIGDITVSAETEAKQQEVGYQNAVGEDSLTRFDKKKRKKKRRPQQRRPSDNQQENPKS